MSIDSEYLLGVIVQKLVLQPLRWLVWATGVAILLTISLGRFQAQPFAAGTRAPRGARPILYREPATAMGFAAWVIAGVALFRYFDL